MPHQEETNRNPGLPNAALPGVPNFLPAESRIRLTDVNEIQRVIHSGDRVIVQCIADWDVRYDVLLERTLLETQSAFAGAHFFRMDTEPAEHHQFLTEAKLPGVPAIVSFALGKRLGVAMGLLSAGKLSELFSRWFEAAGV